jgi:hypothetical protein
VKKKINPLVGALVILVVAGIAFAIAWMQAEAPKSSVPPTPITMPSSPSSGKSAKADKTPARDAKSPKNATDAAAKDMPKKAEKPQSRP